MKNVIRFSPLLFGLIALGCAGTPRPSDSRAELQVLKGSLAAFKGLKVLAEDVHADDCDAAFDVKQFIVEGYDRAIPQSSAARADQPVHVMVLYMADSFGCRIEPPAPCPHRITAAVVAVDHTHVLAQVSWLDSRGGSSELLAGRFVELLAQLYSGKARSGYADAVARP